MKIPCKSCGREIVLAKDPKKGYRIPMHEDDDGVFAIQYVEVTVLGDYAKQRVPMLAAPRKGEQRWAPHKKGCKREARVH